MRVFALAAVTLLLAPLFVFGALCAALLVCLPLFPTRTGTRNLRARLGASWLGARWQLFGVYMHYVSYAIEAFVLSPLGLVVMGNATECQKFFIQVQHKYGLARSTGFLMAGAHYGNIEALGGAVSGLLTAEFGTELYVLAKPSATPFLTRFIQSYRDSRGIRALLTDRKDLVRGMLECLKKGHTLGLLIDQKPASGGLFVSFFGKPCAFPVAGLELGVKLGIPVVYITARRIWPGYFKMLFADGSNLHLKPLSNAGELTLPSSTPLGNTPVFAATLFDASLSPKQMRVAEMVAAYVGWLEGIVRAKPTQWCWDYRKWSREPKLDTPQPATPPPLDSSRPETVE